MLKYCQRGVNVTNKLTLDLISLIVASVGCITGIVSLIIVLTNNVFQIGKQQFALSDRRKSYYFRASDTTTKGCYNVNICAAVSIKATNKSSYPITIDNAYLQNKTAISKHFNDFKFEYIEIQDTPTTTVCFDTEKLAKLPLKLDPFETKYIAFAFPFFDDFVLRYGNEVKTKLTFVTPRKKYTLNISIPDYYNGLPNLANKSKSNCTASLSDNK